MPKSLKIHANSRIDIEDFNLAATGYTKESIKALTRELVLDGKSRTTEGFRVEISDQTVSPGQITVFNGVGYDKSGQLITIEDSPDSSLTMTLAGSNQSFYLEIEYTEVDTDIDARAFWDPTVDNVDPMPDGAESFLSVSTRVTPAWKIVTPVSTTGFDKDTNPQSLRIPLALLLTDASNRITELEPSYFQTASTNLSTSATLGSFTVNVLDARLFPIGTPCEIIPSIDGGPSDLGLSVTVVDYENNVVTFVTPLTANHNPGAILRSTGPVKYLPEEVNPNNPGYLSSTLTEQPSDQQYRLWQGDEARGTALLTSKYTTGSGRDDLNIKSIKDHVDYLSATVREMKFGNPNSTINSYPPPFDFTSTRHYDRSGSIQGAKTNTVSIGDGVNSYGDLNGQDETVFVQALGLLPTGGTIFIKKGNYVFNAGITIPPETHVIMLGESRTNVFISPVDDEFSQVIEYTDAHLTLINLNIADAGQSALRATNGSSRATLEATNCELGDITARDTLYLHRCTLLGNVEVNDGDGRCGIHECVMDPATLVTASNTSLVISSCDIVSVNNLLRVNSQSNVTIRDCNIISERTGEGSTSIPVVVSSASSLTVESCSIIASGSFAPSSVQTLFISSVGDTVITNCSAQLGLVTPQVSESLTVGLVNLTSIGSLVVDNTKLSVATGFSTDSYLTLATTTNNSAAKVVVTECSITLKVGIFMNNHTGTLLVENTLFQPEILGNSTPWYGVYTLGGNSSLTINSCTFDGRETLAETLAASKIAINILNGTTSTNNPLPSISISSSTFKNFGTPGSVPSQSFHQMIVCSNGSSRNIEITNCIFQNIYGKSAGSTLNSIQVSPIPAATIKMLLNNNVFSNIRSSILSTGTAPFSFEAQVVSNIFMNITSNINMLDLVGTTNSLVSSNNFKGIVGAARLVYATNCIVDGNRFEDISSSGANLTCVYASGLTGVTVSNNIFNSINIASSSDLTAIFAGSSSNNINNNHISGVGTAGKFVGIETASVRSSTISNNYIHTNIQPTELTMIKETNTSDGSVTVTGNTLEYTFTTTSSKPVGIHVLNKRTATIDCNRITRDSVVTAAATGIDITTTSSATISNNTLDSGYTGGVTGLASAVICSSAAPRITNNYVGNWAASEIFTVLCTGVGTLNPGSAVITGNTSKRNTADPGTIHFRMVWNGGQGTRLVIQGNVVTPQGPLGHSVINYADTVPSSQAELELVNYFANV